MIVLQTASGREIVLRTDDWPEETVRAVRERVQQFVDETEAQAGDKLAKVFSGDDPHAAHHYKSVWERSTLLAAILTTAEPESEGYTIENLQQLRSWFMVIQENAQIHIADIDAWIKKLEEEEANG